MLGEISCDFSLGVYLQTKSSFPFQVSLPDGEVGQPAN